MNNSLENTLNRYETAEKDEKNGAPAIMKDAQTDAVLAETAKGLNAADIPELEKAI